MAVDWTWGYQGPRTVEIYLEDGTCITVRWSGGEQEISASNGHGSTIDTERIESR